MVEKQLARIAQFDISNEVFELFDAPYIIHKIFTTKEAHELLGCYKTG